jgi:uncharacterized oligopeptide transporter (OPT) family protein
MVVSILGGMLGILMMIPLRRAFIVKQHGTLKYPEGTACADVLVVGETGGSTATTVFIGFGLAFIYKFLMSAFKLWKDTVSRSLDWFQGATPSIEADPALLGVGYIIGTKISCIMFAGGVLSYFVFVPAIHFFGDGLKEPLFPATRTIASMSADEIRDAYVLYIGAGAVATGGIISLFRALPLIFSSLISGLRDMSGSVRSGGNVARRTDRDMPMWIVFLGSILLVAAIWVFMGIDPQAGGSFTWAALLNWTNLMAAVLIVLFGFLFVTVSSRLTGEIGSSSNPISGMTVATLLLTCLIFLILGWTDSQYRLIALSVAAVVCIASSNGGTTSQDLKTGYLVGATPKYQQLSILIGSISSALVIGIVLIVLNNASTVYTQKDLPIPGIPIDISQLARLEKAPGDDKSYHVWQAVEGNPQGVRQGKYLVNDEGLIQYLVDPGINGRVSSRDNGMAVQKYNPPQARLFALITDGILQQKLPWTLVLLGVFIAVVLELCGLPSLPFAVGVYLRLSSSAPIFVGGLVRYIVEYFSKKSKEARSADEASDMSPGVLLSTGYIAGGSIAGVIVGFFAMSDRLTEFLGSLIVVPQYDSIALGAFGFLALVLLIMGIKKSNNVKP